MFEKVVDGEGQLEFLGSIVRYKKPKKWWNVEFDDGDASDYNYQELCAFSTPPDFSILEPFSPPEESQQLLQATTSSPSGVVACPSNASQLKDFRLEKVDYTFISVFFLTTAEPFVGAYIHEDDFYHNLKSLTYDELLHEKGVFFTPMPELYKWIAHSKSMSCKT
jgi:hypothetical protein